MTTAITQETIAFMNERGRMAYCQNKLCAPAMCPSYLAAIEGAQVEDGIASKLAKAWVSGWQAENAKEIERLMLDMAA